MIVNLETRELTPDITAMTLTGRLILGNRLTEVEHAIRQCIEQGVRKLVLDLSGLNYIDSAGLGVIAVCIGVMKQEGGKVVIAGVAGQVQKLLELTHINQAVSTYPDLASAQNALSAPATPPA